jgi:hypothetical protein
MELEVYYNHNIDKEYITKEHSIHYTTRRSARGILNILIYYSIVLNTPIIQLTTTYTRFKTLCDYKIGKIRGTTFGGQ